MPTSADVLSWSTLTTAINEMKPPRMFVKNTVFGRARTVDTINIELSFKRRGRKMAPAVLRNGAAILRPGFTEDRAIVQPPHFRLKRPMTPSELLNKRRAGTVIFPGADGIGAAMRQYIADEQGVLMDDLSNSEEYMACMALQGQISYIAQDESAFTVTFPRSASHSFALTGGDRWDQAGSSPRGTFLQVAQLINDDVSLAASDVILGADAADAFLANAEIKGSGSLLDTRRLQTGSIDLTQAIQESGALFLGEFVHGIRVWRYASTIELPDGTTVDLIRPKYAEFIANSPSAEFVTYYGAIEDMKAIGPGRVLQAQRFSKSWEEEDPSARMILVESNPLPCMRRPDATASVQVIS